MVNIDPFNQWVRTESGQIYHYDCLLSTMPLDRLVGMMPESGELTPALQLVHSRTHVIGIGIEGTLPEHLEGKCWIYFAQDDIPFYRITVFSNLSPENVPNPEQTWSLIAEVAESEDRPLPSPSVIEVALQGMMKAGLIRSSDRVISRWQRTLEYGYPVPTLGRDKILKAVLPTLRNEHLFSRPLRSMEVRGE